MRLSDTSSWPSRASSKASPGGTVPTASARGGRPGAQLASELRGGRPGQGHHDVVRRGPFHQRRQSIGSGGVQRLRGRARRLGHQIRERGVGARPV